MILAHDERGSGDAVVLLHAGIADRRMWEAELEWIAAEGRRAVALDLPGFGSSPPPSELDEPWADALETIAALGIDRFTLAGCSFGGAVAIRVALLAPERVAGLLLVSAPDEEIEPSPELRAAWAAEERALERGDAEAAADAVVAAWTLADAPAELRSRVARMQRDAFEAQLGAAEVEDAPDPLERAPHRLEVPFVVRIAVGELDMPDFRASSARLAERFGAPPPAVVPGAGHLVPLERPDVFRALLAELLEADRPSA